MDMTKSAELKTKIWMTGAHEWFAYIGEEKIFLGGREVPWPLREGDTWQNEFGDIFRIMDGEIKIENRNDPPRSQW
jgi:hypothetical protein